MFSLRTRRESGDTIVEVLIVLSILSLAFVISYATATHGISQSRSAQEHSEALGILNQQLELIRSEAAKPDTTVFSGSTPFCLKDDGSKETSPVTDLNASGACTDSTGLYHYKLAYSSGTGTITGTVRWNGVGSSGVQQEDINYKIGPIATANIGYNDPAVVTGPAPNDDPAPQPQKTFTTVATLTGKDITKIWFGCLSYSSIFVFGGEGCQYTGTSMYVREPAGFYFPYTQAVQGKTYRFAVNYRQYKGDGLKPPVGYGAYALTTNVTAYTATNDSDYVPDSAPLGDLKFPIESTDESYNAHVAYTPSFVNKWDSISPSFYWSNATGNKPELQIDSIEIQQSN